MAGHPVDEKKIYLLTDEDCVEGAAFYFDRFLWETNDRKDLYRATIYKYMKWGRIDHGSFILFKTVDECMSVWWDPTPGGNKEMEQMVKQEFPDGF